MLSSNSPTVVVRNVSKRYKTNSKEFKSRGMRSKYVEALKPISFVAHAGESIGVLGRNGSGKSTLMNLIAGNEAPSEGQIFVSERPTLLSVGAALRNNLSGLDNAKLGLLAQGFSRQDTKRQFREVADWADIGEAVNRALETYSSGMKARLKFSIATAGSPGILLVDEALATGDAAFNAKAAERMNGFLDQAGTVFIVSHSSSTIRKHCNRAIWLHEGEILADSDVESVSSMYRRWSRALSERDSKKARQAINHARNSYISPEILLDSEAAARLG